MYSQSSHIYVAFQTNLLQSLKQACKAGHSVTPLCKCEKLKLGNRDTRQSEFMAF